MPLRPLRVRFAALAALFAVFSCLSSLQAEDKPKKKDEATSKSAESVPRFIRVTRNAENNQLESLDTAISRYKLKRKDDKPVVVDLIGAVHVGESDYYAKLNELFKEYDVVLYELVAPKGTRVTPEGRKEEGFNPLTGLQVFMKDALQLEFQLQKIDYQVENFVHADMSPDEFAESMKKLDESPIKMFFQLMRASLAQQAERKTQVNDAMLLAAFFDRKNGPVVLKRAMALELSGSDVMLEALNGPNGSTIVTERNKVALKVMQEQIEAGHRKIGIFYGAAHLPDMHERMLRDHGFKHVAKKERWLPAWNLHIDLPKAEDKAESGEPKAEGQE